MDLLAKGRVRIHPPYFAGHYQQRYSMYSPRYLKALSVQLGAQVAIVLLAVRSSDTPLSLEGILTRCLHTQIFLIIWLVRENKLRRAGKRDHRLDADEEAIATLGNRHPKFRLTI
jgi:hypothetical protein